MKPASNLPRECRIRAHRSLWTALAALLGALCVPSAEAATYWVGSGAGCTHATLDSAIAAAQANGTRPDFSGADTQLTVESASRIALGTATSGNGGGIYCEAGGKVFFQYQSFLTQNTAFLSGGGVFVGAGGQTWIRRTTLTGNYTVTTSSAAALGALGAGALLVVEWCEMYDNDPNLAAGFESPQIASGSSASLTVAFSTIVEQTAAPGMAVFENANATTMRLLSSVVQAPRTFTAPPPPATQVHCVIVKETASLPAGAQSVVLVTDPSLIFRLSTPEDYSIFRHSEAQDFCDTSQRDPWASDIEGQDRGYDDPTFIDILGPFDIGADEWRPEIFADGFESGTLVGW